ncbi:MAG: cell envelope integrity protein CreD [Cyclobacteriaceae bacterium]
MNEENTFTDKANNWIRSSVTLKLISITILVLLLLIPSSMVKSIISERKSLNRLATMEVSSKWANEQVINGPILTIPLLYEYEEEVEKEKILAGKDGDKIKIIKEMVKVEYTELLHILPEDLSIKGTVAPEQLKRGIYEIIVYNSSSSIKGSFVIDQKIEQQNLKAIEWENAFLTIGVSDLRGVKNDFYVNWNGEPLKAKAGSGIQDLISSGVTVDLPDLATLKNETFQFDFDLKLQGSKNLSFTPIGSKTNVEISSPWTTPSFNGNFLPDNRNVTNEGFTANWNILQLNRNFPQSWVGDDNSKKVASSAFGVDLILPMGDYQKSMRSAKYAIMTIALTFLIFFLVEILNKRKIHPFQYTLVGLSLCLFYVLLVSISEHSNFNFAYGVSTFAIVLMVSLYSYSIFKSIRLTTILVSTLLGTYGFLFVTLQLADYALLMGSVGLVLILGSTMYFTRKIDWYDLKPKPNA